MSVKEFVDDWYDGGGESGNYQKFWWTLLRDVFGVDKPERLIEFQKPVGGWHIDAYIAETKVLIEHKSFGVDLSKKYPQSDEKLLTPYEQAKRYADALPAKDKPRWIVTCNFAEFHIYDRTKNLFDAATTIIKLRDLRYQFERLKFLIDPAADTTPPAEKISKDALDVITKIYDTFAKNYQRNQVADFEDALNKICTRLVFCLYADDAKLFGDDKFFGYLQSFPHTERNFALQRIFDVLNTPDDRRQNFDDALKKFPYVNGGLFDEKIPLPEFNSRVDNPAESIGALNARKKFSWHEIDPPVFGAMFESTFSRAKRQRASGMFYTSTDNIHKVIDPLFLDDLRDEFADIKRMHKRNRPQALFALQNKLAALKFLDPACGSGNFLTETYLSLRRLENEILEELRPLVDLPANPVKVSINQFYGIEIDSFAVAVAKVALWIAENQMLQQTEDAIATNLQALPLKNYATVVRANALRIDWATVAPNVTYIIGNPPFVGARLKSDEQARDIQIVFGGWQNLGNLDYVTCWYKRAADFIRGRKIRCAFVSTNSVCQGDSIGALWKNLFADGIHIDFAHRTFKWLSDSENMAHVHCVVVGFSRAANVKPKKIFVDGVARTADNINAYLVDGEDIFVESRNEPLQDGVPQIRFGSMPNDGGALIIEADDLDYFLQREPNAAQYIRPYIGSAEFIRGKKRYCLWLDGVELDTIKTMPLVAERVEACRKYRSLSKRAATRKLADTPWLFAENRQPSTDYILVPRVSSENRAYIPMEFMLPKTIASDAALIVPEATLYHFGVLTSSIHMAWTKTFCGRLESRYRYSATVVYNNFPWAAVTSERRRMIEATAQNILDVRSKFPTWTFAALYNEDTMPDALRDAHKMNDMAVALAYGYENFFTDEARVVAELMKFYRRLTDG
ncbi:MAG: class I SAM-dependent DNA methyltransferase [Quinella sp. 1Q7]|nr:class I SAM-dependent DNA methyltransferase [Quinella sp. 1Q7]